MVLKIVVCGAGIAGLSTAIAFARWGHEVVVLEHKPEQTREAGAGVQLQPNATRLLQYLGVLHPLQQVGMNSEATKWKRYSDGKQLTYFESRQHGGQWYVLRSTCRKILLEQARLAGVNVRFAQQFTHFNSDSTGVVCNLVSGSSIKADVLIGADGIGSKVRRTLFPAYKLNVNRACTFALQIPLSTVSGSETTKHLVSDSALHFWTGPGRSVVGSKVSGDDIFDFQFVMHDYGSIAEGYAEFQDTDDENIIWLRTHYQDFEPSIQGILSQAEKCWKWRHVECPPLPSWSSKDGRVILVGDACHAVLPFAGQGAGMCIEDAAVLAELFQEIGPNASFPVLAHAFEALRRRRVELVRDRARTNSSIFSMPDGSRQRLRDAALENANQRKQMVKADADASLHTSAFIRWLEDYDAVSEARALRLRIEAQVISPCVKL